MNTKLRNEFDANTREGQKRNRAFEKYNSLVSRDPERAVHVLGNLATGKTQAEGLYGWRLERRVNKLFDATNHGTQIGFEDAEAVWARIHDDEAHTEARNKYNLLSNGEKNTPQGIALRRKRGLQTLRVAAEIHLLELQQPNTLSAVG